MFSSIETSLGPIILGLRYALIAGAIYVIALTLQAVYDVYLHPLAKYSGPKLWTAFPVVKALARVRGQFDREVCRFHEKYGDIVRIGVNEISFANEEAWKDIYGHGHAELQKFFFEGTGLRDKPVVNILASNAQDHFRFRRAMLPAFSDKALGEQEVIMHDYVDMLIKRLHGISKDGRPADMVEWFSNTTFDMIGDLAYGHSFDGLRTGKQNPWISKISNLLRFTPVQILNKYSWLLGKIYLCFTPRSVTQSRNAHRNLSADLTANRIKKADTKHRGDFMDYMMRSRGQHHAMSDDELAANAEILIIAGSETTATLLCGVTYYLLTNPEYLKRCVNEVRAAFASEHEIDFKSASIKLPFMLACLDEGLRIFPPVPTILFRHTLPDQMTTIAGEEFPPKTIVGVHQLSISHSERNFYKAQEFHPERWLPEIQSDASSPFFSDRRNASQPFSVGPRNCIGRNLAYHEMRLILARVLWNFDLQLTEHGQGWAEHQKTYNLWEKPPLVVQVRSKAD